MAADGDAPAAPLPTVQGLDLARYMGRWYEIAQIPSKFQPSDSTNTRATYELQSNGEVTVLNETFKPDGSRASISGKAWKNDKESEDAQFTVQFWVPPFLPLIPVNGDYWVLDLAKDYSYALVGQPQRKYLWILSRKETLPDKVYNSLLSKAEKLGYTGIKERLKKTEHLPDVGKEEAKQNQAWWLMGMLGANKS